MGDSAIAFGNGASASASGGIGNFAVADGTDAAPLVGGENSDFDTAVDIGNNTAPGSLVLAGVGSNDISVVEAPNSIRPAAAAFCTLT